MDGTMLPVCKHKRADDHKVAKGIADFGKNWQGWHYGFKLHASVTLEGKFCAIFFESVFDYLKEHLHLVTSFPMSVYGYLAHYAMVLLGYQLLKIWGI